MANNKSIEEQVEDLCKRQLKNIKYYTKTESINEEIECALKDAPSKSGGKGINYPDIKLFIETKDCKSIPVMIEVKGKKGDLIKTNILGEIDNKKKDGEYNYTNIQKYAINGAIHYANAIAQYTDSYKDVIAIGANGYYSGKDLITEFGVYYISAENYFIPKEIDKYTDLSFLLPNNINILLDKINSLYLTTEEIEQKTREYENEIEVRLKKLN